MIIYFFNLQLLQRFINGIKYLRNYDHGIKQIVRLISVECTKNDDFHNIIDENHT